MSLVNIELHGTVVTHLQQERLAVVLVLDVHALHDVESLQRLFAKGNQNLFSISHWAPWEFLGFLASAWATVRVLRSSAYGCVRLSRAAWKSSSSFRRYKIEILPAGNRAVTERFLPTLRGIEDIVP